MTHNIQNCPRCDHKNDSFNWEINRARIHMECVVCGNHWLVFNEDTVAERASSGIAVVDEIQIENPQWKEKFFQHSAQSSFSKSAITADVFDKQKQFPDIDVVPTVNENAKFPIHIFSLGVMFLSLIIAPQFVSTSSSDKRQILAKRDIDPVTTASLPIAESDFKFSGIKMMKIVRGKTKYINIRASARNVSANTFSQPNFTIFMKNSNGKTVGDFTVQANGKTIKPGEVFQIRREILDETGSMKSVSFAFQK